MKDQSGFTLLELLVSMTLLGLLFVLLFGGLRFGMRAWEHGATTADAADSVRVAQDFLRGKIERACPRRTAAPNPQDSPRVDFTGTSTQLRFLTLAPDGTGEPGCVRVSLAAQPNGTFQRLALELGVNHRPADLLGNAQSIEFSYLSQDNVWQNDWQGRTTLPKLVRLRVRFPSGGARIWPELFVAPRISAEADCTYDPATKSCRGG